MKALLLLLALILTVNAQKQPAKKCSIPLNEAPAIRGLKLGQEFETLQTVLPRPEYAVRETPDEVGETSVTFTAISVLDRGLLSGIGLLGLRYLDGRLKSIHIYYRSGVKWESNLQFTSAIADQLKLPATGWTRLELGDAVQLDCEGFFVQTMGSQFLTIEDVDFARELSKRKTALEQKKRVEFKP